MAYQYGINDLRFRSKVKSDEKDYSSEALLRDPAKCIVCGRCVRMCNMVQSVSALGFSRRGLATTVGPAFEKGLDNSPCVSCGQCSLVCPVAAIEEQDHIKRVEAALADPRNTLLSRWHLLSGLPWRGIWIATGNFCNWENGGCLGASWI